MTVRLKLQVNVNLQTQGAVSGKPYEFHGAGAELDVEDEDVPAMLERKPRNPCCSGTIGSPYFMVVEGRQ